MERAPTELLRGTLDLLVLQVLSEGPMHGYAIGQRIRQMSGEVLQIEHGSLYPSLYRMESRGWLRSRWGQSDQGRRAKIYELTRTGERQLHAESAGCAEFVRAVGRVLGTA